MHLLYLDESGSVADPNQQYFVLAGVSVFERTTHWIEQELHKIAARFDPVNPWAIELHGSEIRSGRNGWKRFALDQRMMAIEDALRVGVVSQRPQSVRLFGAVLRKDKFAGQDLVEVAFEQLSSRFDQFLGRRFAKHRDPQRGIIVLDRNSTEQRIQTLAQKFKVDGHTYGKTLNYAEVPVFLDSKASRLIQLADLVSFSLFRFYEHSDSQLYSIICRHFDNEGSVEHGLFLNI
jgi:Protein of unknown function (DUF3800)